MLIIFKMYFSLKFLSVAIAVTITNTLAQSSGGFYERVPISDGKYTVKPALWRPQPLTSARDSEVRSSEIKPYVVSPRQDLDSSASGYGHHHGRVHIKVFRGPDDHHNHFAPHGYWVKQPADDGRGFRRR